MEGDKPKKVIADTCVWIDFFRSKSETSTRLSQLIADNQVAGTGVILSELLQGVRGTKEKDVIIEIFDTLDYLEMTKDLWIETGSIAARLRSKGKTIPLSDISVVCCAKKYGHRILTFDRHFQEIPEADLV